MEASVKPGRSSTAASNRQAATDRTLKIANSARGQRGAYVAA
jgi:hypothetical protein